MTPLFALGIDIGTSGVRMAVLDEQGEEIARSEVATEPPRHDGISITQDPEVWRWGVEAAFDKLRTQIDMACIGAVGVDGTSGTVVALGAGDDVLAPARMYNDPCRDETVAIIARHAPNASAAHGSSSALGRVIEMQGLRPNRVLHQADWIAALLSGQFGVSDENNALKTGYDPVGRCWPAWISATGMDPDLLPRVVPAGSPIGHVETDWGRRHGLSSRALVVAGTTDGCAAFLATGAERPGDGVTSLGTTLVLKLLSADPVFDPEFGVYSHRIGDIWLAGGASNSGGAALLRHFTSEQMRSLESRLSPEHPTGLDYYPLPSVGERFPISDRNMTARLQPRPADDSQFLQGMLEGIAKIESLGYQRLGQAGAPRLTRLCTVGGGASNKAWTKIRQQCLGVPFMAARSEAAAAGVACLALRALRDQHHG